jgi:hypothetical protein
VEKSIAFLMLTFRFGFSFKTKQILGYVDN